MTISANLTLLVKLILFRTKYVSFNFLNRLFKNIELNLSTRTTVPEEKTMAMSTKKIGLYVSSGVIIAAMIIASIIVTGVQFPTSPLSSSLGTLRLSITDAPVDLSNLYVTLDGTYAHNADNDGWIELNFADDTTEVTFDLLALHDVIQELSVEQIPSGNYTKIRLDVSAATATYNDGNTAELRIPPGHIDVIIKFEIIANQETSLLIDMQPPLQ